MEYNYKEDTLLHHIGFNFQRLESILKHGIVSANKSKELNLSYTKNYLPDNQDHSYISFIKVGNIDYDKTSTAYDVYVKRGISLIVEDVPFLEDKEHYHHHRDDEVLVKDFVPVENIKGIVIPKDIINQAVINVTIIPSNTTKFEYIKDITINYCKFLKKFGANIDFEEIKQYLQEILLINNALFSIKDKEKYKIDIEELNESFKEVLKELNEYLAMTTYVVFSMVLGHAATIKDMINYFTEGNIKIYDIPTTLNDTPKRT